MKSLPRQLACILLLLHAPSAPAQEQWSIFLIPDKRVYAPDDTVSVSVNVNLLGDEHPEQPHSLMPLSDWQFNLEKMGANGVESSRTLAVDNLGIPEFANSPPGRGTHWQWRTSASQLIPEEGIYRLSLDWKDVAGECGSFYVGPNAKPDWIKIQYRPVQPSYFIGEPLTVKLTVRNEGVAPWPIETGGDYRGASRHQRFAFRGERIGGGPPPVDPHPYEQNYGGLGMHGHEIAPGKAFEESIDLRPYLFFPEPGRYAIQAWQALGFGVPVKEEGLESAGHFLYARGGGFEIELRRPNKDEIERLLSEGLSIVDPYEKKYAFRELRHPLYLKPLLAALDVETDATRLEALVEGIGSIDTPDATRALLQLAGDASEPVRVAALQALAWFRLPDPWAVGEKADWAVGKTPKDDPYQQWGPRLKIQANWDESLRPIAIQAIRRALAEGSPAELTAAINCCRMLADPALMPDFVGAVNRAMAHEAAASPARMNLVNTIDGAALRMAMMGAAVTTPTLQSTPGEKVIWASASRASTGPEGEELYLDMLQSDDETLRFVAIMRLPRDFQRKDEIPWKSLLLSENQQTAFYARSAIRNLKPSDWREQIETAINEVTDQNEKQRLREWLQE